MKEGIRKLKFAQQIKKAEGTKTPKVTFLQGKKCRRYGSQQGCLISGGTNRVCRRGGHTGVKVQEDLTPVPSAQVPQYALNFWQRSHNSLGHAQAQQFILKISSAWSTELKCPIFKGFPTARMTRRRRDFSASLPRRQMRKSTHALYSSVTNW